MICPQCGASLPEGSRFCKICGSSTGQTEPPQPVVAEPQYAQPSPVAQSQTQAASPSPAAPKNRLTSILLVAAVILSFAVAALAIAVVVGRGANAGSSAGVTNDVLAASYESILDNPEGVDFLQSDDPKQYELTGTYSYFLIDLHNDGSPDLIMVADCMVHAGNKSVPCTLARVMVYTQDNNATAPTGETIKAGGRIEMNVTSDYHGIRTVTTDEKAGKTVGTTYTLSSDENPNAEQSNSTATKDDKKPNLRDVSDRSLIESLRSGTWKDSDAAAPQ